MDWSLLVNILTLVLVIALLIKVAALKNKLTDHIDEREDGLRKPRENTDGK